MAKKTTQAQTLDIFGDVPAPADMPTLAPPVEAPVVPAVAVENQTVDNAGDTPALDPVDNPAIAPCRVDQQVRSRMSARTFNPGIISTVAELLLGNKNERLSNDDDVRFGTNGSLSICPSNNTFYDHEAGEGGGLLDFVVRHSGTKNHRDAAAWLEFKGLIAGQTMPVAPSTKPTPTAPKKASLGPVIARYDYQDENRAVLFQVRRHEPKDFRQYGFIGGEWVPTVKGIKQVPYRLPQLLAAPIDAIIYIVEGEKDADRLVHLGLFATTCAGGAGKWRATHSGYFQGRRAIIIPDNDNAGRDHAQVVAKSLSGIAASVGVLTLPGLPEKGDVSDWLNAGGTVEELGQLEAVAPVQAHAEEEWDAELMRQAEELDQERLTAGFESLEPNPFDAPPPAGDGDTLGWSDPTPLPNDIPPVAPFDLELLPEALRDWVADIAERMQCPPDFPAVGAITTLSGLIGARAVVKPKQYDDWAVVPVLWGVIIGRPGVMKSPALSEVLKPVKRIEAEERKFHDAIMGEWELDTKLTKIQNENNEKEAKKIAIKDPLKARDLLRPVDSAPAPTLKRYMVNDATVQKLAMILTDNPWGLLVYRDEIHGLLASMDKEGQEEARGFYLTGYDGNQGYAVDRVTREDHYVPRVCLAMLGGIQPGKLQSYVRGATSGGESDDGLLQRFSLMVWPDINKEFQKVDRWPDTPAKQRAHDVFDRLSKLQPLDENNPQEWHFTPEAQSIYWEWVEPFEREIRGDTLHPALVSHLAKYRKLVPALALIFALIDTPDSGNQIDTPELLRALAWTDYLRTHAERVYAAATVPETSGAKTLLARLQAGKLADRDGVLLTSFTAREVSQKHWTGLDSPEAVRKAANLLADYGWLDRETPPVGLTGGRPKTCYLLHPCLLPKGAV